MSQAFAKHNEVAKKHSYLNTILQKAKNTYALNLK